jgi:hypothetical protein
MRIGHVARQDLTNRPFVWGIHSANPSSVKDDPVAILTFGLLSAMERRKGWDDYSRRSIPAYFSNQIASLQALSPKEAWRCLIPWYREKLLNEVRAGGVSIKVESILRLESSRDLETEALTYWVGDEPNELSFRSLFAELDEWNDSEVFQSKEYSRRLASTTRKS